MVVLRLAVTASFFFPFYYRGPNREHPKALRNLLLPASNVHRSHCCYSDVLPLSGCHSNPHHQCFSSYVSQAEFLTSSVTATLKIQQLQYAV